MKYEEVPAKFHSAYMKLVAEKLSILKMTKEERANYSYYQKQLHNDRDELVAAEARGEAKRNIEIAKNMLIQGIDVNTISIVTSLSVSEIEKL